MESIQILEHEHDNISEMLDVIQHMAIKAIKKNKVNTDDFRLVSEFISEYADGHHHDKEEKILFDLMLDNSGPEAQSLIRYGMLAEHDMARYYNMSLKLALDDYDKDGSEENLVQILTFALAYRDLLTRHIDKENKAAYPLAERTLPDEIKEKNEELFKDYQDKNNENANKYLTSLEELKKIYL